MFSDYLSCEANYTHQCLRLCWYNVFKELLTSSSSHVSCQDKIPGTAHSLETRPWAHTFNKIISGEVTGPTSAWSLLLQPQQLGFILWNWLTSLFSALFPSIPQPQRLLSLKSTGLQQAEHYHYVTNSDWSHPKFYSNSSFFSHVLSGL